MLKTEHLTVRYGEKAALQDLDLVIREGEWWCVVGPNGAGKSTLAGALARTVPYEGLVTLRGRDIRSFSAMEYARCVAVLSQHQAPAFGFTVEEIVRLGRYAHRTGFLHRNDPEESRKVDEALALTGLSELRRRNMQTLSGGERQRVFLAQALCQEPDLLILDEPANHLDLPFQQELFTLVASWLEKPGRAVITVMHDLSAARAFGTRVLLLNGGRCVSQGGVEEVLSREHLKEVYGMDVHAWMRDLLSRWQEPED